MQEEKENKMKNKSEKENCMYAREEVKTKSNLEMQERNGLKTNKKASRTAEQSNKHNKIVKKSE